MALVAALLLAIPSPSGISIDGGSTVPSREAVRQVLPDAARIGQAANEAGLWPVYDAGGNVIARVARTLPTARDVVGYRGPTEAMILFDPDLRVVSVRLLESADTAEHVQAVLADEIFFEQFRGWSWDGPDDDQSIDAVSGATLTSMALAEGVLKRIGGDRPSLVFPERLTPAELRDWFPKAASITETADASLVRDDDDRVLGRVLRSGIFSDDVMGYQGPSELLWKLSNDGRVTDIKLRHSYDNEPYVRYVRVEAGFWGLFTGKTIDQLAQLDPEAAGIEGVSGATMTSLAVADTIVATAQAAQLATRPTANEMGAGVTKWIRWTTADVATISVLLLAALISRLGWFRHRTLRRIWLIAVVAIIGLWAGNLISLALVAGWSAEGAAWRLAPGLSAIAAIALLSPPLTKANPYCNHLCPHGAVQQLIRPGQVTKGGRRRKLHPSKRTTRWLSAVPGASLVLAYVAVIVFPTIDLSTFEPFHAYLLRIAGWGAIAFCLSTLAVATVIPMGYCRFGCPTGRLIDYLRRTATSQRIQTTDLVALVLLILAVGYRWLVTA